MFSEAGLKGRVTLEVQLCEPVDLYHNVHVNDKGHTSASQSSVHHLVDPVIFDNDWEGWVHSSNSLTVECACQLSPPSMNGYNVLDSLHVFLRSALR